MHYALCCLRAAAARSRQYCGSCKCSAKLSTSVAGHAEAHKAGAHARAAPYCNVCLVCICQGTLLAALATRQPASAGRHLLPELVCLILPPSTKEYFTCAIAHLSSAVSKADSASAMLCSPDWGIIFSIGIRKASEGFARGATQARCSCCLNAGRRAGRSSAAEMSACILDALYHYLTSSLRKRP